MTPSFLLYAARYVAASASAQCGVGSATATCGTDLPKVQATSAQLSDLLQIFFGVIAAVAVLMIMISGLRFITGHGNPQEISKARSTIIYSLAGLIVALLAEAIVSLVLNKLTI
jgi:hypothetical protein